MYVGLKEESKKIINLFRNPFQNIGRVLCFCVSQKQPIDATESYATDVGFSSFIKYTYIFVEAMESKLSTIYFICVCVGVFFRDTHHKRDEIIIFIFYLIFSCRKNIICLRFKEKKSGNFQVKHEMSTPLTESW